MLKFLSNISHISFLLLIGLREAVAEVRAAGKKAVVATPRIIKPDEQVFELAHIHNYG